MEFDDFFLIRWFSIMTVRRFGLKLNGFCPGSGFGIKAGQGGGLHTYIQNGIDIFSV